MLIYCIRLLCDWSFHFYDHVIYISYFLRLWHSPYGVFCVAIRKDSVSLIILPFLNHVDDFLCDFSLVYPLRCPYSCFSSPFRLLFLLRWCLWCLYCFLVVVNSFRLHSFIFSSCRSINASTLSWLLVSPLLSSVLDTYSLSIFFPDCKVVCIVMSFLVPWSIRVLHWSTFRIVPSI